MLTQLFWIEGPWSGRLAFAPRPRGGEWLADELRSWRRAGVDVVVSMLTRDEQDGLDLSDEAASARATGIEFLSFPVSDRGVPASAPAFAELISDLGEHLQNGKRVAIHCRQGIGRAALVAVCLLIAAGVEPAVAVERVGSACGCTVPETAGQRRWITEFADSLAARPLS